MAEDFKRISSFASRCVLGYEETEGVLCFFFRVVDFIIELGGHNCRSTEMFEAQIRSSLDITLLIIQE